MSKKTKSIIGYIALVAVLVTIVVLIWVYAPAIKGAIDNERYYTPEEVEQIREEHNQEKADMQEQIDYFKSQVDKYLKDIEDYKTQVTDLTKSLNEALSQGNIDKEEIQELNNTITELNNQIHNLNNQVTYYQELLEAYENNGKLIVTFMLVDNGTQTVYDVQAVEENDYLAEVISPDRIDFEGWSLTMGGELIDNITTIQVTENMTIYGMCTNTVTFIVNGEEYTKQEVSYGKYATDVEVILSGYTFNGWSLTNGGEIVNVDTISITTDTTFYTELTKTSLTTFEPYSWNYDIIGGFIWTDGTNCYYSQGTNQMTLKDNSWVKETWGETSNRFLLQGNLVWSDGVNYYYSPGGVQQYVLDLENHTCNNMTWYGLEQPNASYIWTDGVNYYYSNKTEQYILNVQSHTWSPITWNGYAPESGLYVWTDGTNCYYSNGSAQYKLNTQSKTWSPVSWNQFTPNDGRYIWTDGTNYYYSNGTDQYQLNTETSTWTEKLWIGLTDFNGINIWTDGEHIYYSSGDEQYILV